MRNYHIVSISEPVSNISGYQKILTNNIEQIINHSADNILCSCLEYQEKSSLQTIIKQSLSKIKPQGQITISLTNFKKLFEDFLNSKIPSSQIFDSLRGKNNIVIIEDILTTLDTNVFKLININYAEYNISINIERVSI
jgi:hypothetical protein